MFHYVVCCCCGCLSDRLAITTLDARPREVIQAMGWLPKMLLHSVSQPARLFALFFSPFSSCIVPSSITGMERRGSVLIEGVESMDAVAPRSGIRSRAASDSHHRKARGFVAYWSLSFLRKTLRKMITDYDVLRRIGHCVMVILGSALNVWNIQNTFFMIQTLSALSLAYSGAICSRMNPIFSPSR